MESQPNSTIKNIGFEDNKAYGSLGLSTLGSIHKPSRYKKKWDETCVRVRENEETVEIFYLEPHTIEIGKDDKLILDYETVRLSLANQLNGSQIGRKFDLHRNTMSERIRKFKDNGIIGLEDNRGNGTNNKDNKNIPKHLTNRVRFLREGKQKIYSRYALGLLHIPYLERLGFYDSIKEISLDRENGYSTNEIYQSLYFIPVFNGERIHHLNFFPNREFSVLVGNMKHPKEDSAQNYLNCVIKTKDVKRFIKKMGQGYVKAGAVDGRILYIDSFTSEYFGNKNLEIAPHGTKNKMVKSTLVHYSFCGITNRPLFFEYTRANKRIPSIMSKLIIQSDEILATAGRKSELIAFDRGGYGVPVFKKVVQLGKIFACWTRDKRTEEELKLVDDDRFFDPKIETLDANGNKVPLDEKERAERKEKFKEIEKMADCETHLLGWGKIRTIIIKNYDSNRRIGIYVSADRDALLKERIDLSAEGVLDIMRKRQNIENFLEVRKNDLSADKFCGGMITEIEQDIKKPDEKELQKLKVTLVKAEKKTRKFESELIDYDKLLEEKALSKAAYNKLRRRAEKSIEKYKTKKKHLKKLISWGEGGKAPKIKPIYEIDTQKMAIINAIRDANYIVNDLIVEDFVNCVKEVISEEGIKEKPWRGYKNMTPDTASRVLYDWGGYIEIDEKGDTLKVVANKFDNRIVQKAYETLCVKLNVKKPKLRSGGGMEYALQYG